MDGKKRFLLVAVILSVLLLSSPVYAAFYKTASIIIDVPPGDEILSYNYPVNPNPGCSLDPNDPSGNSCIPVVKLTDVTNVYGGGCSASQYQGTLIGDYYLGYNSNFGNATWVGGTNICPPNYYYVIAVLTGNGTWCNGGINCYDMDILASWKSVDINITPGVAPVCSFTAVPTSGASPLLVTFTDTSTGSPTSWDWLIKNNGTGFTEQISSSLQSFSATLNNPTTFDVNFTATNAYGNCNLFAPNYITTTTPATTTLTLSVVDAISHNVISGASVGLQNITSLAWTNTTAPTGSYTFINSDGTSALPLSVGQTVTLAASAYGYNSGVSTITIPYSGYSTSIALMPTTAVNATGTFWLTVYVSKNEDGLPLQAIVQVLSGGQSYQSGTAPNGYTTFQNITSSTTFSVTAFAQAYQAQTKVLPVTADFMNVSFSLVRIGATPVATPVTPKTTSTTAPVVSWTGTGGQPVSESEGNALDAFLELARALPAMVNIGIGIIMIWLLWVLVYELTGGKIIDKMMRRGRRR